MNLHEQHFVYQEPTTPILNKVMAIVMSVLSVAIFPPIIIMIISTHQVSFGSAILVLGFLLCVAWFILSSYKAFIITKECILVDQGKEVVVDNVEGWIRIQQHGKEVLFKREDIETIEACIPGYRHSRDPLHDLGFIKIILKTGESYIVTTLTLPFSFSPFSTYTPEDLFKGVEMRRMRKTFKTIPPEYLKDLKLIPSSPADTGPRISIFRKILRIVGSIVLAFIILTAIRMGRGIVHLGADKVFHRQRDASSIETPAPHDESIEIRNTAAVYYHPTEAEMDTIIKNLTPDEEDGFYAGQDDMGYYDWMASRLFEEEGVPVISTDATYMQFIKDDGTEVIIDRSKLFTEDNWFGLFLFDGKQDPFRAASIRIELDYEKYFHKKVAIPPIDDYKNDLKELGTPAHEQEFYMGDSESMTGEFRAGLRDFISEEEYKNNRILIKEVTWGTGPETNYTVWFRARDDGGWEFIDTLEWDIGMVF